MTQRSPPDADLGHQVGDQHRLARARGPRDDGVLGLGPLRIRDAGNAPGPRSCCARRAVEQAQVERPQPSMQLGPGDQFRAPDSPLPPDLHAAIPEDGEEERDQPAAGLEAEPGARQQFVEDLLARLERRHRRRDVADGEHAPRAVGEADFLARVPLVAERELGFGQRRHAGGIPFRARGRMPQVPGRDGDGGEGGEQQRGLEQLAPHADAVEDGLAAPERSAADARHQPRFPHRAARRQRPAGRGPKEAGPESVAPEAGGGGCNPRRRRYDGGPWT